MRAWIFQRKEGSKEPWSVGWYDPEGSRREKQIGGKTHAKKFRDKIQAELVTATYQTVKLTTWKEFRCEYERIELDKLRPSTAVTYRAALDRFEELVKPAKVSNIDIKTIDEFVAKRRKQRGAKKGSKVAASTINSELRTIRRVLKVAAQWKYIAEAPKINMLKEPAKLKNFVSQDHFEAIYKHCDAATSPKVVGSIEPVQWWRGLVVFTYLTGWRIGETLSLRWEDVDLDLSLIHI